MKRKFLCCPGPPCRRGPRHKPKPMTHVYLPRAMLFWVWLVDFLGNLDETEMKG